MLSDFLTLTVGDVPAPSEHIHAWSGTWITSATHHWHNCTAAGCPINDNSQKDGYAAHIIGDWVTDKQPTATAEGSRYKACTVCGYELEREVIPATGSGTSSGGSSSSGGSTGGSSSSSGSSGSSPNSTTTKNPDGSTTTTTTNRVTGTVTETTRRPDGSKLVLETQKDGTVTSTETAADGSTRKTVTNPDGSGTLSLRQADGTTVQASTSANGAVTVEVTLASSVQTGGTAVALPVSELVPGRDTVIVHTGKPQPVKVTFPAANPAPGVVAVVIDADGSERILRSSILTEGGITAAVPSGAAVKLVDNSKDFFDTDGHWAKNAVAFASSRELFAGTGAGVFSPEGTMTRAMSMTVLARLADVDISGGSSWYQKSVEWAVAQGLSDGSALEVPLTREQLVTMLYRYAGSPAATNKELHFSDGDAVSGYALEAMCWGVESGILNGYGNGILAPGDPVTRAQAASMLMRLVNLLGK